VVKNNDLRTDKMRKTIILLLIGLLSLQAFAETKPIVQEGKGIAPTRQEAIKRAIFEAVAKAKGISVGSGEYEYSYDSASADIERKGSGKEIGFDAVSIRAKGSTAEMQIGAFVKTYEVLEEKKIDANSYEVKLKVWIYDYQAPDKTGRLRIAVMPPTTLSSMYRFGTIVSSESGCTKTEQLVRGKEALLSSRDLERKVSHILNTKLTATNKFAVLDRNHIDKVMQEKGLVFVGDTSLEEKAKLGNLLGADYILAITVTEVVLNVNIKYVEITGQCVFDHDARIKLDYSLIGAATGQIKFSDSVTLTLEDRDVRKLVPKWQDDKIDYLILADELIKSATGPIVDKVAGGLYPARIAKILPQGQIAINKGGKDIAESDIYDVLKEGTELFDYDTKESLGKIEEPIATIKITKVMSNFSYAVIVQGDASKLSEGLICRKQGKEPEKPIEQQSDTTVTPSGGVKMPFDK
jgi:hypothetical protein